MAEQQRQPPWSAVFSSFPGLQWFPPAESPAGRRGKRRAACRAGFLPRMRDRQQNGLPTPTEPPTPKFRLDSHTTEESLDKNLDKMPNDVNSYPSPCFSQPAHNGLNSERMGYSLQRSPTVTQYTPPVPVTQNLSFPFLSGGIHPGRGEREGWELGGSCGCPKHHFGQIHGATAPSVRPAGQSICAPSSALGRLAGQASMSWRRMTGTARLWAPCVRTSSLMARPPRWFN